MISMHDWTLETISLDWASGVGLVHLLSAEGPREIVAKNVQRLLVPRALPWGMSVSINVMGDLVHQENGSVTLSIELQSGDIIEIEAASFSFPNSN